MGLIQLPQKKRIRIKLPNTERLRKARAEHNEWLKKNGLDNIKPRKKTGDLELPKYEDRQGIPLGNKVPVKGGYQQPAQHYSGERKLIGIATMHKSNQVPVFADDTAEGREKATEISRMRRG
jgi:hypothetical protein